MSPVCLFTHSRRQQEAVARAFEREHELFGTPESYFQQLPAMKKEKLASCLESVGLQPIMPEGGYFIVADITSVKVDSKDQSTEDEPYDFRFVKWLIKERGLANNPRLCILRSRAQQGDKYIRFCFIKENSTLDAAEDILRRLSQRQ